MTSRQMITLEELPNLIKKTECELDNVKGGYSYAQSFFNKKIIPCYLENESKYQKEFIEKTSLGKDVFQEMRGGKKTLKIKREYTLLSISFGLGLTYEDAFLLFWFYGKNLLTDDSVMMAINEILFNLDVLTNEHSAVVRLIYLDDLIREKGLNFKK